MLMVADGCEGQSANDSEEKAQGLPIDSGWGTD